MWFWSQKSGTLIQIPTTRTLIRTPTKKKDLKSMGTATYLPTHLWRGATEAVGALSGEALGSVWLPSDGGLGELRCPPFGVRDRCMHIYIYKTCTHTYLYVHRHTHIDVYRYMYIYIHTCVSVYRCIYIYIYFFFFFFYDFASMYGTHTYIHMYIHIYIDIYVHGMYINTWKYVYMYIYIGMCI